MATNASGLDEAPKLTQSDYLSDHPELFLSSSQDWGILGFDTAAHLADKEGPPLQIGDKIFTKGLGHHANGVISLMADGQYESLDAQVGIQPSGGGSVVFRVFVDGKQCFDSGIVHNTDGPKPVHVSVIGAQEVRLEAKDAGDGVSFDMANWVEARFNTATNTTKARSTETPIDVAPFARVVTWDPNRMDAARASRTEEFRAEDLFTETDLKKTRTDNYDVPAWTNGVGCIGLQWLNRRSIRELVLVFAGEAQMPDADSVRVEAWFGESVFQGKWQALKGAIHRENSQLILRLDPKQGVIQTQKIRWVLPASPKKRFVRLSAFTRSKWSITNLFLQVEKPQRSGRAKYTIWNGESIPKLDFQNQKSDISWKLSQPLHLSVHYSHPSIFKSDPTMLHLSLPTGDVTVAIEDVLTNDCVYLPDHGLFVAREPLPISLDDYKRRIANKKTILEEVCAMPDQTLDQAMMKTHHDFQKEGPIMLSLACDNNKFVVQRDGAVCFQASTNEVRDWFASAGEMRLHFGNGKSDMISPSPTNHRSIYGPYLAHIDSGSPGRVTRTLEGGWFPIPVITATKDGLMLMQRSFVAPSDEAGTNPTRLNRRSIYIAEFAISNTLPQVTDVSLSLNFLLNTLERKSARLSPSPLGWVVQGDSGVIGLISIEEASRFTISESKGSLSVIGKLSPDQVASLIVFLPDKPTALTSLPNVTKLHAETQAYWNAVLAPTMQIVTPDSLLNNVIRASQVSCLIAARNEADGARVAAWIAAMNYGPFESEAHSVIRGMDFMGHADFARRSLDFFIHRYNTNGFLTTGYTVFGTPWHLWTLAEHSQISFDGQWLRQVLPEILRVGHWIVRQTEKTKKHDIRGKPMPEYGLMPPGVIADWNSFAYHFTMNGYYFAALRNLGAALDEIGHPEAGFFKRSALELQANTLRAYAWTQSKSPALALRNGTWIPHYPSQVHSPGKLADFFPGQDEGRTWCYDVELGAHQLVSAGVLDPRSREVERMMDHMEDVQFLADGWFDYPATMNRGDWFNLGGFSKVQPYYTRNCEVYALRDDIKPFVRSYFNTLAAMLNPEVLTIWEHFRHSGAWNKTHETGNFLYQTRLMLVQERDNELRLAPFITSNWLRDGQSIAVKNAPTRFGEVSFEIISHVHQGYIEATIDAPTRQKPKAIVLRLRHPEGQIIRTITVNGTPNSDFNPRDETVRIVPDRIAPITVRASY